jgi:exodeoxyribonuclease V alpha subunit
MLDILLMHALLQALKPGCRLILVGDAHQLPSVGPGNLLSDLLRCGRIPSVELTEIFRQARESAIVMNAHRVNRGEPPDLRNQSADFFFLRRRDGAQTVDTILELCKTRLPERLGIDPAQIQVLSPTRLRTAGTNNLNRLLQEALNPPSVTSGNAASATPCSGKATGSCRRKTTMTYYGKARTGFGPGTAFITATSAAFCK